MKALLDAAGNVIPTDACPNCGRPKLTHNPLCCVTCSIGKHLSGCNIRCAGMEVPGFGVRVSEMPLDALVLRVQDGRLNAEARGAERAKRRRKAWRHA